MFAERQKCTCCTISTMRVALSGIKKWVKVSLFSKNSDNFMLSANECVAVEERLGNQKNKWSPPKSLYKPICLWNNGPDYDYLLISVNCNFQAFVDFQTTQLQKSATNFFKIYHSRDNIVKTYLSVFATRVSVTLALSFLVIVYERFNFCDPVRTHKWFSHEVICNECIRFSVWTFWPGLQHVPKWSAAGTVLSNCYYIGVMTNFAFCFSRIESNFRSTSHGDMRNLLISGQLYSTLIWFLKACFVSYWILRQVALGRA